MEINNIDLGLVELLAEKLNIKYEEVIDLALNELAIRISGEDSSDMVQKSYKDIIKEIRNGMFKVYNDVNKGRITVEEMEKELSKFKKLLDSFSLLSKADGNITGFITDYKEKIAILQREKEYQLKKKTAEINAKIAEHNIMMGMTKIQGGLR